MCHFWARELENCLQVRPLLCLSELCDNYFTFLLKFVHREKDLVILECISRVHSLNCVRVVSNPWTAACHASLCITNSQRLLKLMSIKSVMPSNHLILCCRLLLLPSFFPSIGGFSNELVLRIRCPKYWSFNLSITPSNKYSGLISFRINWFDLLAVQGTLKSLLQHHSSKASVLQHSTFFMVQLSHPYVITGKTIALTRQTFVDKVHLCFWICCLSRW